MEISCLSEKLFRYAAMYCVIVKSNTPKKIAIAPSMRYNTPLTVTPSGRLWDVGVDNHQTTILLRKSVKQFSLPMILGVLLVPEFRHSFRI